MNRIILAALAWGAVAPVQADVATKQVYSSIECEKAVGLGAQIAGIFRLTYRQRAASVTFAAFDVTQMVSASDVRAAVTELEKCRVLGLDPADPFLAFQEEIRVWTLGFFRDLTLYVEHYPAIDATFRQEVPDAYRVDVFTRGPRPRIVYLGAGFTYENLGDAFQVRDREGAVIDLLAPLAWRSEARPFFHWDFSDLDPTPSSVIPRGRQVLEGIASQVRARMEGRASRDDFPELYPIKVMGYTQLTRAGAAITKRMGEIIPAQETRIYDLSTLVETLEEVAPAVILVDVPTTAAYRGFDALRAYKAAHPEIRWEWVTEEWRSEIEEE